MRTRHSLISLVLVVSLLLAPASLAAPSMDAGFGWFSQVKAFVVDVFGYFGLGDGPSQSLAPTDQGTLQNERNFVCDPEMGAGAEPNGCT